MRNDYVEYNYASNGMRFLAYLVDILPISIIVFALFYFFLGMNETFTEYLNRSGDIEARIAFMSERRMVTWTIVLVWVIYGGLMESTARQATLGKSLMGLKVINKYGDRLSLQESMIRNVLKVISYLAIFLGFVWILFDRQKQGFHDKTQNTFVVEA